MMRYIDIELPDPGQIRQAADGRPDTQDCHAWSDEQWDLIRQHDTALRENRLVIHDPTATAARYPAMNPAAARGTGPGYVQVDTGGMSPPGACPPSQRDGGTPQYGCEDIQHCWTSPLGFNTFGDPNYPLVGAVIGAVTDGGQIEVSSGRMLAYQAKYLFFTVRDQAAGFARSLGQISTATISENSQLAGSNNVNRPIPSDLFENIGPLALDDWRPFTNTEPNTLLMTFGTALGPGASLQFQGVFFGGAPSRATLDRYGLLTT